MIDYIPYRPFRRAYGALQRSIQGAASRTLVTYCHGLCKSSQAALAGDGGVPLLSMRPRARLKMLQVTDGRYGHFVRHLAP